MKKEIKLNLGCGVHLVKDFINVDIAFDLKDLEEGIRTKQGLYANAVIDEGAKFVRASMVQLPFPDNYADYIESLDSIEHVGFRDISVAIQEMYRVLKPKGKLVLMTVDFNELARLWMNDIVDKPYDANKYINLMQVIYGNQIGGSEECHKTLFNVDFLTHLLVYADFKKENIKIKIYPTGNTELPPFKTQKWDEGHFMRTSMIYLEAIK